ncbi:hypothetical protein BKA93DRAFT_234589 [Sparassis latifolia]
MARNISMDFDLATASTRDYIYANKTMRYPYFQTMSHQPMHINHWIEIDNEYEWYLGEKARIVEEQGKVALDSLPENDDACGELLELVVDYLPKRYPTLFERIPSGLGIWNKVTNERFPDVSALRGVEALRVVSRLVQDDFLMARERPDGRIYLVGGLLAFPGNYLLSEKMDQPVHVLHDPVPHFNSKLLLSVERTLVRFTPDKPFERSSWMIVDDRSLFWHNIASAPVPDTLHPKDLFLRVDHQTFRKLRRTGGIMFGVHPVLKRIGTLADSPLVPAMLAKLHTESDKALLDYKLVKKYNPILLPYLQEVTEQQIARGLIREEDLEDVSKFREHVGGEFPMWHVKPTREAQAVH